MRITGVILIVLGIVLMVFSGVNFQTEKNVANIGPLEINKKENKHIGWPIYVGGIVTLAGIALAIAGKKK